MKRLLSLAILAAALVCSAAAQTVNISVPALDSTGAAVTTGIAYITWNRFTTDNGIMIYGNSMTVPITSGTLAVSLYSSDTNGYDSGYVYNVLIEGNGLNSTYKWKVPATGATTMAQLNKSTADGSGGSAATLTPLGNDLRVVTTNGKGIPGNCLAYDTTGYNVTDAGSPCGAGGGAGLAIPTQSGLAKMTASSKTLTPAVPGTDYQAPIPNNTYDTYGAAAAITLSSLGAQNATLPNAQNLAVPTFTGIPKLTSGSNTPGQAVAGTDYLQPSSIVPANRAVSLLNVVSLGTKQAISGIAPTLTYQSSDTITNSQRFNTYSSTLAAADTAHFLFEGGKYLQAGPTSPRTLGVYNIINTENLGGSPATLETLVDSSQFEYEFIGSGQAMKFYIDGSVVLEAQADLTTGTAQAGGASSITLASGASATSGAYNSMYVYITGGTGAGQSAKISTYVGTTKVATLATAWTTTPDSTSTYRINQAIGSFGVPNDGSGHYILFTFGGVRATRRLKIVTGGYLFSLLVDSSGSLTPPSNPYSMVAFGVGDSFTEGTNAMMGYDENFFSVLCNKLGWEPWNLGQGGTGFVNNDSGLRLPYPGRVLPPANSWVINIEPLTAAGTFTLTQGSTTTSAIATNASVATLQAALNTAFGSGTFFATAHPYYGYVIEGQGSTALITTPMTVAQTGGTGTMSIFQYLGDIAPYVPVDGRGNPKPFVIFLEGSGNDDAQTGVQAAASALYAGVAAKWPQAYVLASGRWMNSGPAPASGKTTDQSYVAASASLPTINGHSAFIDLFNNSTGVGYLNCQTSIETPTGASGCNTDYYVSWDGTHPTTAGYNLLSNQLLTPILNIFAN